MVLASPSEPLSQLETLVVDCQATAAAPRGHLQLGWARVLGTTITHAHASLIALPDGEQIPPAVARITGISEHMMRSAVDGRCAGRADRPGRESHAAARADRHPLRSIRAAVPFQFGRRRVSARRGLHAGYCRASFPQSASLQPACPFWIFRSRGRGAASQRRSRRGDGVRLARVGSTAGTAGCVDVGRAPRLARQTGQADRVSTPRVADAAGRAAFAAGCPWHLSHAADRRERPVRRQGSVAPSSGQQLLSEAKRRARAVARDAVAGPRDSVRRHTKSARGRTPRAG